MSPSWRFGMKVTYPKVGNMSRWLDHSTSLIMRVEEALSSETGRTMHSWHGPSQTKVSDVSHACQWKPTLSTNQCKKLSPWEEGGDVVFCLESEILCDCIESDTGVPAGISSGSLTASIGGKIRMHFVSSCGRGRRLKQLCGLVKYIEKTVPTALPVGQCRDLAARVWEPCQTQVWFLAWSSVRES